MMSERKQHKRSPGLFAGRLTRIGRFAQQTLHGLLAASFVLSPVGARADISNTALVSGHTPSGKAVTSAPASALVKTLEGVPVVEISKSGTYNDDDGIKGPSGGDTISYTVTVANSGTGSLKNFVLDDQLAPMTYVSGDADLDGAIDPGETWEFTGYYVLTQNDIDSNGDGDGKIEDWATLTGGPVNTGALAEVPLDLNPQMTVTKNGVLNDDDGQPGLTAGDTITYSVTVENTGNLRLSNPVVSDPLVTLAYEAGDTNGDGFIDVDETWTYTGTAVVSQGDLDTLGGGDGDLDNTATVTVMQLPPRSASHELPIAPISSLDVTKTVTEKRQLFPTIYEIDYQIAVLNDGAVTQTGIAVSDDLSKSLAPAIMTGPAQVSVSGFEGSGGYNSAFNGTTDINLLTGDVQLQPGSMGVINITVQIDTGGNSFTSANSVELISNEAPAPVLSDDPAATPEDTADVNPAFVPLIDEDGDGAPDGVEVAGSDRDGDGISDPQDYDPTGYFYCQADGRILQGGRISVTNLTNGGSQDGAGSSNGVTVVRDGSDGHFQFHANEEGTFLLSWILPPGGVLSTDRTSLGTLEVSSLLPDNPAVLGSGEYGSTGFLADSSSAENPFYTRFEIKAGDPSVFNNNIPLMLCGTSQLSATKEVASGPDLQDDGSHLVTYRIGMEASGNERVDNVQLADDLASVFGGGKFTIEELRIESAPAALGASADPFYDGQTNTALLTTGGTLEAGEAVSMLLTVRLSGEVAGVFDNLATATGERPLDGQAIEPATDDARIEIEARPEEGLVVRKSVTPGAAPLGAPVTYTISVSNPTSQTFTNVAIVDSMPSGLTYVPASARIGGTAREPDISGRELSWNALTLAPDQVVTIKLRALINASAAKREFVNLAYARDGLSGQAVSNIAKARLELETEPVFQCSDLIGRVFDDTNRNGYYDTGEPGLPGVRLATARGLLITTDKFGRYHIACGAIPDAEIGSNFIVKLDPRSLPTGYVVTSENPRVVRLTRGKLSKLNFAAANLRVVRLELTDDSFQNASLRLKREALESIGGMLAMLDQERTVLKIVYKSGSGEDAISRQRLSEVKRLIEGAWSARKRSHELVVETALHE